MTSTTLNMSMMKNSPQLLSYDIAPGVRAFSTMRHGGVGEGAYCSLISIAIVAIRKRILQPIKHYLPGH